ncbi:uncharacterized protein LOC130725185 [Lotus japonicus]|uniref:uncharacterized protein LOC130725185 n=1 Tax=Lotus japonicus TaxID=34305 RepID=UPI00258CB660|nr:uncharacterized protein LOC130725185 [Lotus japonicus]
MGSNLFTVRFHNPQDRDRILRAGPWNFDKFLMVMTKLEVDEVPSQVPLTKAPFWVQVHDFPPRLRSDATARAIGKVLGEFMEWDHADKHRDGQFLRVRVMLDVTRPLLRGSRLARANKEPLRVRFKYERLGNVCNRCGKLDHYSKDCSLEAPSPLPYGAWIKADTGKQGFGSESQRQDDKKEKERDSSSANEKELHSPTASQHSASKPRESGVSGEAEETAGRVKGLPSRSTLPKRKETSLGGGSARGKKRSAESRDSSMGQAHPSKKLLSDAISADAAGQVRRAQ